MFFTFILVLKNILFIFANMNTTNELKQKLTITPIAMKCNQEQFNEIKVLLESGGCKIVDISDFIQHCYLVNNFNEVQKDIGNVDEGMIENFNRKVYHKWDKNIFLNASNIAFNLSDIKIPMSDKFIDVSSTPKEVFKMTEPTNPLHDLPIIGDGVLMKVSMNNYDWSDRYVFGKCESGFLAWHEKKSDIVVWTHAQQIPKTKITRKEFESKFEIID